MMSFYKAAKTAPAGVLLKEDRLDLREQRRNQENISMSTLINSALLSDRPPLPMAVSMAVARTQMRPSSAREEVSEICNPPETSAVLPSKRPSSSTQSRSRDLDSGASLRAPARGSSLDSHRKVARGTYRSASFNCGLDCSVDRDVERNMEHGNNCAADRSADRVADRSVDRSVDNNAHRRMDLTQNDIRIRETSAQAPRSHSAPRRSASATARGPVVRAPSGGVPRATAQRADRPKSAAVTRGAARSKPSSREPSKDRTAAVAPGGAPRKVVARVLSRDSLEASAEHRCGAWRPPKAPKDQLSQTWGPGSTTTRVSNLPSEEPKLRPQSSGGVHCCPAKIGLLGFDAEQRWAAPAPVACATQARIAQDFNEMRSVRRMITEQATSGHLGVYMRPCYGASA